MENLLADARHLAPELAAKARQTDSQGITPETVAALKAAGFFRLLQSARHGGLAAGFDTYMELGRILGRVCGATAWLVSTAADAAALVSRMTPPAQEEIWGKDPDALITRNHLRGGGTLAPAGAAWRLSGSWPAVGGTNHAEWIILDDLTCAGDTQTWCAIVRTAEIETTEREYFGGLRGVAFRDITADDVMVPSARAMRKADLFGANPPGADAGSEGPLGSAYDIYAENRLVGMALGMAEGAYADYTTITRARVSGIGGQSVAKFTHVQSRLGETHADLKSAEALYDVLKAGLARGLPPESTIEAARDRAYIARRALEAVTRLVRQMGAMGIAEANPVQRHYRDIRTVATDESLSWDVHMARFGRQELGVAEAS